MLGFNGSPWRRDETLGEYMERTAVSRRDFLTYCGELAALLGLSSTGAPAVAEALQASRRASLIWLQFQSCTGCVESLLRTESPTIGDLVLRQISLEYNRTIQAAAGNAALAALKQAAKDNWGHYLLAVEGSIPQKDGGIYDCAGGVTAQQELEELVPGAAAVLAIGACAHWVAGQRRTRTQRELSVCRPWCTTSRWSRSPGARLSLT